MVDGEVTVEILQRKNGKTCPRWNISEVGGKGRHIVLKAGSFLPAGAGGKAFFTHECVTVTRQRGASVARKAPGVH